MQQSDTTDGGKIGRQEIAIILFLSTNGIVEDKKVESLLQQRPVFAGANCAQILTDLEERELVTCIDGQCMIEENGQEMLKTVLQEALKDAAEFGKQTLMPEFHVLDMDVKKVCIEWQSLPDGSKNLHEDQAYDFDVLDKLHDLHEKFLKLIGSNDIIANYCADFISDMNKAMDKVDNGDFDFVVGLNENSYHSLWHELHELLLQGFGIERTE